MHFHVTFKRKPETNRIRVLLARLEFFITTLRGISTFGKFVTDVFVFELYTHFKFKQTRLYQTKNVSQYNVRRSLGGRDLGGVGWIWWLAPPSLEEQQIKKLKIMNNMEDIMANTLDRHLIVIFTLKVC